MPSANRSALTTLARVAKGGTISVPAAADALRVAPATAAARLARMARTGWVARLRRGLYLILPLETRPGHAATPEDPWVLGRELFSPCYIGGWSAAEHWGLTEQLFRSTLVVTSAAPRGKVHSFLGATFRPYRVRAGRPRDGIVTVWRGSERMEISGPERTLVDCLGTPSLCGGTRHLVDMLRRYKDSDRCNLAQLTAVARATATGAAWKRLGYLCEVLWPDETELMNVAKAHLSAGLSKLDPGVAARGRIVKRWRLWVNVELGAPIASATTTR